MSNSTSQLPAGFEALEPFVEGWAIAGADNRLKRRLSGTEAERIAFFEAAKELVAPALAHLDVKPLGELDEREQRLMDLMLGFAHVAMAVEVLAEDEPKHARGARYMTITQAPSDLAP